MRPRLSSLCRAGPVSILFGLTLEALGAWSGFGSVKLAPSHKESLGYCGSGSDSGSSSRPSNAHTTARGTRGVDVVLAGWT
ncbi:hypothetical protein F4777DRAFT_548502 [Nemania sp. FL0916]|nr:hypothetical protein F4777DRAFT_548502 [Nemania sp. FL0916]